MKNKRTRIFLFFDRVLLAKLFPFFDSGIRQQSMGTMCAQLLIEFDTDQFEPLQALLSWSVDVHVILALSSI